VIDSKAVLKVALALGAFAAGLAGAMWWRAKPPRQAPPAVPLAAQASLFDLRCASCHGREDGTTAAQTPLFRNPWPSLSGERFDAILEKGIPGKMLPHPGLDDKARTGLRESALAIQAKARARSVLEDGADDRGEILARVEGLEVTAAGRPAIVYCFSPDCVACQEKLPALAKWAAGHPGVDVVAVCQGTGAEATAPRPGLTGLRMLADPAGRSRAAWDTSTSPTILLVDEEGRVRARGHEWKMPGRPVSRVLFPGTSPG